MKMRMMFVAAVLVLGLSIATEEITLAQEKPAFNPAISLKDNLATNVGRRVSLTMGTGESVEGTLEKVGDHFVLVSKLSGKDFYDALIRIDDIKAVIFKAR